MDTKHKFDSLKVYCALHNMGFNVGFGRNDGFGPSDKDKISPINDLGLIFDQMPEIADDRVYVTQGGPQIQVSMTLEKYLQIVGIHPRKQTPSNIIPFPAVA